MSTFHKEIQWNGQARDPFWVVLYGVFSPREYWVHVIGASEDRRQIPYSGTDYGEALKVALDEATRHGLPVTFRLWEDRT